MVVLTGGIASGKTAVSDRFGARGVPVIDADVIAHQVVEPGQPALLELIEAFGKEILDAHGALDRRRMREAVFADPALRSRLEGILHPAIRREAKRQIAALEGAPYCLFVVPLLAESGRHSWIDRVLVVDVPVADQVERVMARDGITATQAKEILAAQANRKERLALADDVIDNSGSLEQLNRRIESLHKKYLRLAGIARNTARAPRGSVR